MSDHEYQLYFNMRTTKMQLKTEIFLVRMRKFLLNFSSHAEISEVAICSRGPKEHTHPFWLNCD